MKLVEKHPILMIVIGVLGISMSSIFVRYSAAPSVITATYRLLWTVLMLLPPVFGKKVVRKELLNVPISTGLLCCLSGLFLAIHFVLWFESLQHTSVASSTTIVCTEVIWVALGFCIFMRGKLSWKAILAIAVSLFGSGLIAMSDFDKGNYLYGDVLALLAAVAVGVYTLIGRVVRARLSTTVYTFLVYCSCASVLVLTCIVQGEGLFQYGVSPVIVGALLAIFSTLLGHSIFSWCLKYFSPSFVSASKLCEPVVAAVFAWLLFAEIPGWQQVIGGLIVIAGVLYYSTLEAKS